LTAVASKYLGTVPTETQVVALVAVFGFSFIFDAAGLASLHFGLDAAFDFFQDRPHIIRIAVSCKGLFT
jgi:hypothetical protein